MTNPKPGRIPPGAYCVDAKDPRAVRMAAAPGHTILRTKATRMGSAETLARSCAALPELLELFYEMNALNFSCLSIGAGKMANLEVLTRAVRNRILSAGDAS